MKKSLSILPRLSSVALLLLFLFVPATAQKLCTVPYYDDLSEEKRGLLTGINISREQWNGLSNDKRLSVFNIMAAIKSSGLEFTGIIVDWTPGRGVEKDRIYFMNTNAFYDEMKEKVPDLFSPDIGKGQEHVPYTDSYRHNVLHRSLQLSFTEETKFDDAARVRSISDLRLQPAVSDGPSKSKKVHDFSDLDLDFFNPNWRGGFGVGSILHGLEVTLMHSFAKLWGWGGKTSPYSVAFRRDNWECLEDKARRGGNVTRSTKTN